MGNESVLFGSLFSGSAVSQNDGSEQLKESLVAAMVNFMAYRLFAMTNDERTQSFAFPKILLAPPRGVEVRWHFYQIFGEKAMASSLITAGFTPF